MPTEEVSIGVGITALAQLQVRLLSLHREIRILLDCEAT